MTPGLYIFLCGSSSLLSVCPGKEEKALVSLANNMREQQNGAIMPRSPKCQRTRRGGNEAPPHLRGALDTSGHIAFHIFPLQFYSLDGSRELNWNCLSRTLISKTLRIHFWSLVHMVQATVLTQIQDLCGKKHRKTGNSIKANFNAQQICSTMLIKKQRLYSAFEEFIKKPYF